MHILPLKIISQVKKSTDIPWILFPPTARCRHLQVHRCVVCAQRSHAGQEWQTLRQTKQAERGTRVSHQQYAVRLVRQLLHFWCEIMGRRSCRRSWGHSAPCALPGPIQPILISNLFNWRLEYFIHSFQLIWSLTAFRPVFPARKFPHCWSFWTVTVLKQISVREITALMSSDRILGHGLDCRDCP